MSTKPTGKRRKSKPASVERDELGALGQIPPTVNPDGTWFDEQHWWEIERGFFPTLKHHKGEWAARGECFVPQPWQADYLRKLLCLKRPDGLRQIRNSSIFCPRKVGKTFLSSAVSLYHLLIDQEPANELIMAAADLNQANHAFAVCRHLVESCELWRSMCRILRREIVHTPTGSVLKVVPGDGQRLLGGNAGFVLIDELLTQKNRDLYDALQTSQGARRNPQFVTISTAGWDRHSLAYEIYQHCRNLLAGTVTDPSYLPVVYGLRDEDMGRWDDESLWAACNPNLNVTVPLEYYRQHANEAKMIPSKRNAFIQLFLSGWPSASSCWIPAEVFDKCAIDRPSDDELRQCPSVFGLDLAAVADLSVISPTFRLPDGRVFIDTIAFLPEAVVQREKSVMIPWRKWEAAGFLHILPGEAIDQEFILEKLKEIAEKYGCHEVVLDRFNSQHISQQISLNGITVTQHGQGYASMGSSCAGYERGILNQQIVYDRKNEILRWAQANTTVLRDPAGNMKPDRRARQARIDPVVAAIMGHARMEVAFPPGVKEWDGEVLVL
jgi:phage terminase large subunit-like protein